MTEQEKQAEETVLDLGVRDHGFKYPIEKVLRLRAGGQHRNLGDDAHIVVLGQLLELCPGGCAQRTYTCRVIIHGGRMMNPTIRFYEFELEPSEPFPDETKGGKSNGGGG